jgi:putative transposase
MGAGVRRGEANLAVRRRKKVRRRASERVPLQLAQDVNEVWSMDPLAVRTDNGPEFTSRAFMACARSHGVKTS